MRVATKIGFGAGLMVALMVAALGFEIRSVQRLERINRNLSEVTVEVSRAAIRLRRLIGQLEFLTDFYFADIANPSSGEQYPEKIEQARASFDLELEELKGLVRSEEESRQLEFLTAAWSGYRSTSTFDSVAVAGFTQEQLADLNRNLDRALTKVSRQLDAMEQETREQADTLIDRAKSASDSAVAASVIVVPVALGICLLVLGFTVRSINEPLGRLVEGTRAVAAGRFFYQIDLPGNDEFSLMAESFNEMVHRLGEIENMKREFLSHVSHELRTPLVAMQETSALLLEELPGPLNDKQRRLISLSLNGSKRLSAMISKLLDLSRIEAGAIDYDLKRHDLVEVANTAVGEFEARAREHELLLRVLLPNRSLFARCDRDRVIQVVENLIENAIKFSPPDETIEIEVKRLSRRKIPSGLLGKAGLRSLGSRPICLTVSDAGPGVAEADRERIFEKFRQLKRGKSSETGVGLGLAICREIVQAHGGAIWVEDSAKGGSAFKVALPADRTQPDRTQNQKLAESSSGQLEDPTEEL